MASTYAQLSELRGVIGVLDQLTDTNPDRDTMLQLCLDDAQAIIDNELGGTLAVAASGTQVVYGDGTIYLTPRPFTSGTAVVTAPTSYTTPAYVEQAGALVITNSSGVIPSPDYPQYRGSFWVMASQPFWSDTPYSGGWVAGVPYSVLADFGASPTDMNVLRRLTLEVAVSLWKFRDAGGSTAIGTENAVVVVTNAFSPIMRSALTRLKQKYVTGPGVW